MGYCERRPYIKPGIPQRLKRGTSSHPPRHQPRSRRPTRREGGQFSIKYLSVQNEPRPFRKARCWAPHTSVVPKEAEVPCRLKGSIPMLGASTAATARCEINTTKPGLIRTEARRIISSIKNLVKRYSSHKPRTMNGS